jgi:hypothetical protein
MFEGSRANVRSIGTNASRASGQAVFSLTDCAAPHEIRDLIDQLIANLGG